MLYLVTVKLILVLPMIWSGGCFCPAIIRAKGVLYCIHHPKICTGLVYLFQCLLTVCTNLPPTIIIIIMPDAYARMAIHRQNYYV